MSKAWLIILFGILLLACGEVDAEYIPPLSSSSGGESEPSSSSAGSLPSSSSSDSFDIGIVWRDAPENSKVHGGTSVTVSPYMISENLITQAQYRIIMGNNPSRSRSDLQPVDGVTWYNAMEFARKLSISMDLDPTAVRLPTEAEWEIATCPENVCNAVIWRNSDYWEWTFDCFDSKFPWVPDNPRGPNCLPAEDKVRKGFGLRIEERFSTDPFSTDIGGGFISFRVVRVL